MQERRLQVKGSERGGDRKGGGGGAWLEGSAGGLTGWMRGDTGGCHNYRREPSWGKRDTSQLALTQVSLHKHQCRIKSDSLQQATWVVNHSHQSYLDYFRLSFAAEIFFLYIKWDLDVDIVTSLPIFLSRRKHDQELTMSVCGIHLMSHMFKTIILIAR